ncbi:MBL fold metallo-hydrolase [Nocardiopsis sp. RSe5-2]|uniref:MBL fold metallo-hydrolase n=1 Tax=Nocardiopsis endophytica TaxID=3018445 RepID=A0ABT4UEC4_9ACTN|nr:MBL fold metallo-hydrolase [Nocardiopsis endophytica]MDA2815242.1 MBL fold metallo-hydrolase [Nocardiopsis endophytica]
MPTGDLTRRTLGRIALGALTATALPATAATAAHASTTPGTPYYDRARRLAADDPVHPALANALHPAPIPPPPPTRITDDLAVLSVGFVHAMALTTDRGIVLFDALESPDDARTTIEPGLRALGADPADITHIVITHGHYDHFGGAQYLADRHGARVLMSPTDWDLVEADGHEHAPRRDIETTDGHRLDMGSATITLHHTPGHTPGTISALFGTRDRDRPRTAMLWGGTNPPTTPGELRTYLDSIAAFRHRMHTAGADIELSNHPNDHGLQRMQDIRDDPDAPNPFVLGRHRTDRFMKVMDLMIQGRLADAQA